MKENVWIRILRKKRIWLLSLIPISVLILGLAKQSIWIAEKVLAKGVFRIASQGISFITGWLPFSLAEWIVVLGPILLLIGLIIFIVRLAVAKTDVLFRVLIGMLNVLCVLSIAFFLYTIGCGTNYYRESVGTYLGLTVEPSTEQELYGLCLSLANQANELRAQITSENEAGIYTLSMSIDSLAEEAVNAYKKAGEEYEIFRGKYPKAKPLFFSKVMSRMGLTGIFIPFTMEANVNVDVPDYSIVSTMCHELAHLHGFIREDEANYIAYFICMNSGNPELAYSGVMEALILAGNALYDQNKELYSMVRETYSEGVAADLYDNSLYWNQFENTTTMNTVNKINDTYLKVNNQVDGVKSYGRMVDLLLAEYRKQND